MRKRYEYRRDYTRGRTQTGHTADRVDVTFPSG
jgi:hypothetical protein